jgi:hypothetical protein
MRENYEIGEGYGGEAERARRIEYMKNMLHDAHTIASGFFPRHTLSNRPELITQILNSMMLYEISAEIERVGDLLDDVAAGTSLIHDELEKRNDK